MAASVRATPGNPATTPGCRATTAARPESVLGDQGPGGPVAGRAEIFVEGQGKNGPQIFVQAVVPNDLAELFRHLV